MLLPTEKRGEFTVVNDSMKHHRLVTGVSRNFMPSPLPNLPSTADILHCRSFPGDGFMKLIINLGSVNYQSINSAIAWIHKSSNNAKVLCAPTNSKYILQQVGSWSKLRNVDYSTFRSVLGKNECLK